MAELSPMMQQYQKIKAENQGAILFFRLGDFYEMFFDDAVLASKELELTLTARDCGQNKKAPMCGVPYHSIEFGIPCRPHGHGVGNQQATVPVSFAGTCQPTQTNRFI